LDTIESLIQSWDGENIIIHPDRPSGATIVLAIHSTRLGPAGGGTRMKTYPSLAAALQDAMNLSAGMTYKFAAVGFQWGGGKCVIAVPPNLETGARKELLRRYGAFVHSLGGLFYTGSDVGTTSEDMDVIAETGAPYVFGRTQGAGGAGSSGPPTAIGVVAGMQTVCEEYLGGTLAGKNVLVQGVGSVGAEVVRLLRDADARLAFSDVDEQAAQHWRKDINIEFVPPERIYETPCDIFSPCALGGVLNENTIPKLRCRAVVGSANNQLASVEDAERLHTRGIFYAPDFVINVGGAMALIGIESSHWSWEQANQRVAETVKNSLREVLRTAQTEGINSDRAARRIAEKNLGRGAPKASATPNTG
jgi:leucine dehydrogenase